MGQRGSGPAKDEAVIEFWAFAEWGGPLLAVRPSNNRPGRGDSLAFGNFVKRSEPKCRGTS